MCDIGTAALVASGFGKVTAAIGQRRIGRANAATGRAEAAQTREIGRYNESRARDRMERLIAQQRGSLVARGVNLSSTSAERMGAEAAAEAATEAAAQRFNTDSRATAQTNDAILNEARGQAGFLAGISDAGSSTLTGALRLWPELAGT